MERTFDEMLDIYREVARRNGAPLNDVARAAAYMVHSSYHVYTNGRGMTDRQFTALRARIERSILEDRAFHITPRAEKQQILEDLAISGSFVMFAYQAGRRSGNQAALTDARQLARQNIEQILGVSPERVRLLDDGIDF